MSYDKVPKDDALIALKQSVRDDIEFIKRQQWLISYYTVLLYSAIVGVVNILKDNICNKCAVLTFLWLLSITIFWGWAKIIFNFNKSLESYRGLAIEVECRLNLRNLTAKYRTEPSNIICYVLTGTQFLACLIVLYAVSKLLL